MIVIGSYDGTRSPVLIRSYYELWRWIDRTMLYFDDAACYGVLRDGLIGFNGAGVGVDNGIFDIIMYTMFYSLKRR